MINDTIKTDTFPFMNPPEPPPTLPELKEALQQELEKKKRLGKHREWFEEIATKFLLRHGTSLELEAYETCLRENLVEDYSDEDYANLAINLQAKDMLMIVFRIVKYIIGRKLILHRNSSQAKTLLSQIDKEFSDNEKDEDKTEGFAAIALLMAESLTIIDEDDAPSPELSDLEKHILQQSNIEAVDKCIRSGFFPRKRVDEYLDFIAEEGVWELTPLFVSLKFKEK